MVKCLNGETVCVAVYCRYGRIGYWSPFSLIGQDVYISISNIRHAMLDQHLDHAEEMVAKLQNSDPLNPPTSTPLGEYSHCFNFPPPLPQLLHH